MANENIDEGVEEEAKKHTAGHILFQSLKRIFPEMRIIKDIFKHEKTALIVRYPKQIDWDKVLEAEKTANKIVEEDREVRFIHVSKEKILEKFGDKVRGRWDLIKDETIRVVEVDDFDYSACMGKHVKSAGKIEMIIITGIHSLRKDEYEIIFEVGREAKMRALELVKTLGEVSEIVGAEPFKLPATIKNIKSRLESFERNLRILSKERLKSINDYENVDGIKIYSKVLEGFDRNEVGKHIFDLTKDNKTIAVFANIDGEKATISAGKSNDLDIDLLTVVKAMCKKLGGNAGGKNRLIVGGCNSKNLRENFKEMVDDIKNSI